MKEYTIQEIKDKCKKLGYQWDVFNIIAIRSRKDEFDRFDDNIYIAWNNDLWKFNCTTNPGSYYLITKFLNPNGCAVVRPGQYKFSHQLGLHRGKHEALVQRAPITVWRDNNKNEKSGGENALIETEVLGINIHGTYTTYKIEKIFNFSAGCIVINDPTEFKSFLDKCKKSKQKYFTLTLLEEF